VPVSDISALLKLRENGAAGEWPECGEIRYTKMPTGDAIVDQAHKRLGTRFERRRLHPFS
jgi:hypothetical protein